MLLTNLPAMIVVFRILIKSLIFLFYWMRLCIVVNWPNAASIRHFTLWLVLAEDTFIVMQLCPRSFFFSKYFSSKNSNHCTLGWFSSVATAATSHLSDSFIICFNKFSPSKMGVFCFQRDFKWRLPRKLGQDKSPSMQGYTIEVDMAS